MKGNINLARFYTMADGYAYEPLDLHQRGDLCYALKKHAPKENRHSKGRSSHEVKAEVFNSARLQRTVQEVRSPDMQEAIVTCTCICDLGCCFVIVPLKACLYDV